MPDIDFIRGEIQRTRLQVLRHRNEIMQLQRAGVSSTSAEALLDRMLTKIDDLCDERDRLKREQQHPRRKRGRHWWSGSTTSANPTPFLKELEAVRHLATREGWRYQHVQAIIVSIDQYAEAATGNREYFRNKPQTLAGNARRGDVP
jgi:hypothetical protein